MLKHNELKKGTLFILNNQPFEVLEHSLVKKGRGGSVMQVKVKSLQTGNVLSKTFHQGEEFEEAELEKINLVFIYNRNDKYVFSQAKDKSKRIELSQEQVGNGAKFLKQNQKVTGLVFEDKIINIILPIKVALRVTEAPPGVRAGRAEAGTKQVTLETNAKINTPLFVEQGDIVEINTETEQYVRRAD